MRSALITYNNYRYSYLDRIQHSEWTEQKWLICFINLIEIFEKNTEMFDSDKIKITEYICETQIYLTSSGKLVPPA